MDFVQQGSRPKVNIGRMIGRTFKKGGYIIQADAVRALQNVLKNEDDPKASLDLVLQTMTRKLDNGTAISGNIISVDLIMHVVAELTRDVDDITGDSLQVISAFDSPIVKYDGVNKSFYFGVRKDCKGLFGGAEAKVTMFRDRLELIRQRLERNKDFAAPTLNTSASSRDKAYVELSTLDSLVGITGHRNLLGMITQRDEGHYWLEDLNGSVRMDLSNCKKISGGLFTEGCVVVASGTVHEDVFYVEAMGFPPPEDRMKTLQNMQTLDITRLTGYSPQEETEMLKMEQAAEDAQFVVFSDVHLDNPTVMQKLKAVFLGYETFGARPELFIFMGNFTSRPFGQGKDDGAWYRSLFDELGDLIASFDSFKRYSKFVFVPGPTDPGSGNVLPRHRIPKYFTKGIEEKVSYYANDPDGSRSNRKVSNVFFTSNPCRIRYYTQEIVISRQNILNKMRRNCVVPPANDSVDAADGVAQHLVKTLMDQSHLCPLPLSVQPVYWNYDNALRLYPLPDMLILGDYYDQFLYNYEKCAVMNPGSFPTDFSFVVYRPAQKVTEFSRCNA